MKYLRALILNVDLLLLLVMFKTVSSPMPQNGGTKSVSPLLKIFIIAVVVLALGFGGWYFYQTKINISTEQPKVDDALVPTKSMQNEQTIDQSVEVPIAQEPATENTQIYKNEKIGFQFEYPSDLIITEEKSDLNTLVTPTKNMLEFGTDGSKWPFLLLSVNALSTPAGQKDDMDSVYKMAVSSGATRTTNQMLVDGVNVPITIDNFPAGTNPKYNISARSFIWAIFTKNTNNYFIMLGYPDKNDTPVMLEKFKNMALSFKFYE